MPVLDLGEPLLEQQRHLAHVIEEARLRHLVEHGVAGRDRERIAAEGRAVGAGRHAVGGLGGGQHRADREARAETLGQRHDVGRDAELLVAEHLAEPADAGLHLVEGEQQALLVAERAEVAEELRRRHADTALALQRLDHDAGGLGRDGALDRGDVAERNLVEALHRRPEAVEMLLVLGGRERRQRPAVERAFERDDAVALGMAGGG